MELLLALPWWQSSLAIILGNYALYFLTAGGTFWLFHRRLAGAFATRRFAPAPAQGKQIRRELLSAMKVMAAPSALSLLVFHVLMPQGLISVYARISEHGWPWYIASFAILFVIHDTTNYWTHRTMHHRLLFKRLHSEHHLSTYPTPWGAFSSSLTEITLNSAGVILGMMLIPTHETVLPIFMAFSVAWTVSGHIGYDLQQGSAPGWPTRLMAGGAHHAWHHRHVRGNYGMYTRLWDRIMGTDKGLLMPHALPHALPVDQQRASG